MICIERIGENAILIHSHAIVTDIRSSGEPENNLITNYRRLSAKFLVSSVKVIYTVGYLWFLLKQLVKFVLGEKRTFLKAHIYPRKFIFIRKSGDVFTFTSPDSKSPVSYLTFMF